jgi:hypothetical protein
MTILLSDLITRACDAVDVPQGSAWLNSTVLMAQANVGLSQLRDIISMANSDYFLTKGATPLTITSGVATLPADCLKIKWLFLLDNTQRRRLVDYRMDVLPAMTTVQTDLPRGYKQTGLTLQLLPPPPAGSTYTVELWYDADLTPFTATTTPVPSLIYPGWEEFIVCHMAAFICDREERDSSIFLARKREVGELVKSAAVQRDEYGIKAIRNTRAPLWDNTSATPPNWGVMY